MNNEYNNTLQEQLVQQGPANKYQTTPHFFLSYIGI
jgi:hypothetical protein